jgi:DNA polymerase-3 subunit epsilon
VRWRGRRSAPWRGARFAVLDFETTGLDFDRDHVLSFGVVPIEGGRARVAGGVYRVVRPPVEVPAASIRVHGIRPAELDDAPALADVVDDLADALEGRVLVAHAAGVELGFLDRIARLHGRPKVRRAIDVLDLADVLASRTGGELESRRLAAIADRFGVPLSRTHHAFGDALATAQLFLVLATRLEPHGLTRVRDLERARRSQFARSFARTGLDRACLMS